MRFLDYWSEYMWPNLKYRFRGLLQQQPLRQDGAVGCPYDSSLLAQLAANKKICGVPSNLAWTDPAKNTVLQEDIPLSMVANFVCDMFLAGPVPTAVEHSELADHRLAAEEETRRDQITKAKRVWRIPTSCPATLHIPIVLTSRTELPQKGLFRRYGMDCAVNGVWLALYWAMLDAAASVDGAESAIEALERLILDWRFDFELFEVPAETPNKEAKLEELIFAAVTNVPLQVGRQRDFFGLTDRSMMLICGEVRKLLKLGKVGANV